MGKLEHAFKGEIVRLARKEAKVNTRVVAKEVVRLKRTIAEFRRTLTAIRKEMKLSVRRPAAAVDLPGASDAELRKARFSPSLIQKLRKRLGITQGQLASLLDVTPGAVAFWEQGRSRPRDSHKRKIVTLRGLGKRDVARLLTSQDVAEKPVPAGRTRRKKATRRRVPRKKVARKRVARKKPAGRKAARRKTAGKARRKKAARRAPRRRRR